MNPIWHGIRLQVRGEDGVTAAVIHQMATDHQSATAKSQ
jgi:hypothetical protein